MGRWVPALAVVAAAGAVTAWHSYQLQRHHLARLPPREVAPGLLALSVLPTGLLLAASALRRRSVGTQAAVALVAVAVCAGRVGVMRGELAADWGRATGIASGVAWAAGAAGIVLVVAAVRRVGGRGGPDS